MFLKINMLPISDGSGVHSTTRIRQNVIDILFGKSSKQDNKQVI